MRIQPLDSRCQTCKFLDFLLVLKFIYQAKTLDANNLVLSLQVAGFFLFKLSRIFLLNIIYFPQIDEFYVSFVQYA